MNKTTEHLLDYVMKGKKNIILIQNPGKMFHTEVLIDRAIIFHCHGTTTWQEVNEVAQKARKEDKALFIGDLDLAEPEVIGTLIQVQQDSDMCLIATVTKSTEKQAYVGIQSVNRPFYDRFIVCHTLQEA